MVPAPVDERARVCAAGTTLPLALLKDEETGKDEEDQLVGERVEEVRPRGHLYVCQLSRGSIIHR